MGDGDLTIEECQQAVPPMPTRYTTIMARATESCSPAAREILEVAVRDSVTQKPTTDCTAGGCMLRME
jgi:hypothetical protein